MEDIVKCFKTDSPAIMRGPEQMKPEDRLIWPGCSKLTTLLINKTLDFQMYYAKIMPFFAEKNVRSFCTAKASHFVQKLLTFFSVKNISALILYTCILEDLTLGAPNKNCSRRHFNFLLLCLEENRA